MLTHLSFQFFKNFMVILLSAKHRLNRSWRHIVHSWALFVHEFLSHGVIQWNWGILVSEDSYRSPQFVRSRYCWCVFPMRARRIIRSVNLEMWNYTRMLARERNGCATRCTTGIAKWGRWIERAEKLRCRGVHLRAFPLVHH